MKKDMWNIIIASVGIAVAVLSGTQSMLWSKVDAVSNANNEIKVDVGIIRNDTSWIKAALLEIQNNAKQQSAARK